jgi:carboxylesterase type B
MGLYDQILALEWIQKYIKYFGGNPQQITIAGQSAGGAAVTYLLDSPMAKGLFHGVITSSGDSFAGWAIEHNPLKNSLSAASSIGCANGTLPNQDMKIVLKCMQSIPSHQILDALPAFFVRKKIFKMVYSY